MATRIVQSKQNARVKELRSALQRPGKADSSTVAIEGIHLLAEAVRSGLSLDAIFIEQGHENLLHELGFRSPALDSMEVLALPAEVLASAVSTESPQPIAALGRPKQWSWSCLIQSASSGAPLIVVLAGIQDPGNLGTILRSTEAFGSSGVVLLPGTVTPWNPKAVRASAGSVFRLPVLAASPEECFRQLRAAKIATLAAMAHDAEPLGQVDLSAPVALFIGSEGGGLPPEIASLCDARITIPCPGPVESLNAAVAASVLLYEASRQRSQTRGRP